MSFLEVVNLVNIGISSHYTRQQVPNDLPTHGQIVDSCKLRSQEYLDKINLWSDNQEMIVSEKKNQNYDRQLYGQISVSHTTTAEVSKRGGCKENEDTWDNFH